MNQFEFEAILKVIQSGAPALAEELTNAFVGLVERERTLALKVKELEERLCEKAPTKEVN